jgi:hypothetical protein
MSSRFEQQFAHLELIGIVFEYQHVRHHPKITCAITSEGN